MIHKASVDQLLSLGGSIILSVVLGQTPTQFEYAVEAAPTSSPLTSSHDAWPHHQLGASEPR